jgi:hypothetical protein
LAILLEPRDPRSTKLGENNRFSKDFVGAWGSEMDPNPYKTCVYIFSDCFFECEFEADFFDFGLMFDYIFLQMMFMSTILENFLLVEKCDFEQQSSNKSRFVEA